MKLTPIGDPNVIIRSALQAVLQKVGLVTPYDLQHILKHNKIELEGKEKRERLEELFDETNSKLVYGNVTWDSILYPYVLTQRTFDNINESLQELIFRFKQDFSISRKEMGSILIGILMLSFKKRFGDTNENTGKIQR